MAVKVLGASDAPGEGETLVALKNTIDSTLHIGILQGEYLRVLPTGAGDPTRFALTADQLGRYQRQLDIQPVYLQWLSAGYLVDVTNEPPPPEE